MSSTPIERLRYYDLEYLRAFDFAAEQLYHLEMRRRLNLALHLRGIVVGLDLAPANPPPGVPQQYYVDPGIAIDAYGREILLAQKYLLGAADLQNNKITAAGDYAIWIAYDRLASQPPGPGYVVCNVRDQLTRWRETFQILIGDVKPRPGTAPEAFDPLSDDPTKFFWPIRLGTITAGNDAIGNFTVIFAKSEKREYIGLRAQRILAPVDARPKLNPNILEKNSPHLPPTSVCVESNLFAQDNAIIGRDFLVDQNKFSTPPPSTPPFPSPTGNLKVASDLFLQGSLYSFSAAQGKWLGISDYIKSQLPDIKIGTQVIPVAYTGANPSEADFSFSVATSLPNVTDVQLMIGISSINWNTVANLIQNWTTIGFGNTGTFIDLAVILPAASPSPPGNSYTFKVHWKIQDAVTPPATGLLPIVSLTINYIAVFSP